MSEIITYLVGHAELIGKVWLLCFVAGYPFNIGLGRTGLQPMSYGQFLRQLTAVNAFLAAVITGLIVAADLVLEFMPR